MVLVADDSEAIKNGFLEIFGMDHSIVMCWAHMRERLHKKLCLIEDKTLHTEIMDDVDTLQLSKNKKHLKLLQNYS